MSLGFILLLFIIYLLGSILGADLVMFWYKLPNLRQSGSENPGATNMLRVAGKKYALIVLLVDALKGALTVCIGKYLELLPIEIGFLIIAICLGHIAPIWKNLKGGKGIATSFGILSILSWQAAILIMLLWLSIYFITKYSSISSITTVLIMPITIWFFTPEFTLPITILSCFLLIKHYRNIDQLINGNELKLR